MPYSWILRKSPPHFIQSSHQMQIYLPSPLFFKKKRDGNPVPRTARNKAYYYRNTSQWFGQKKKTNLTDEKVDFLC